MSYNPLTPAVYDKLLRPGKPLYVKARVGNVQVKQYLTEVLEEYLTPIRERRAYYEKQPELVRAIF